MCVRRRACEGLGFLGIGLDALTLAATILTVVIDDDAFGSAFESVVRYNDEGEIVGICGDAAEGVPFTDRCVSRMLESEPMASPGRTGARSPSARRSRRARQRRAPRGR